MSPHPPQVLVAEDHPGYRDKVAGLLAGWGLAVALANDGRQAIRLLRAGPLPDLLVTDLAMPYATGFEVIDAWLAARGDVRAVIMVTGEADAMDVRIRCAGLGVALLHKAAIDARFERAVRDAANWLNLDLGP